MSKPTKEYINRKISNCRRLVDEATSDPQREIYQGYLDFWTEKLPKAQRPEIIAERLIEKAEFEAELTRVKEERAIKRAKKAEEALEAERLEKERAYRVAKLKAQLKALGDNPEPEPEELNEINFEKKFPNKKAYRTQNGERIETIAYKEYLNKQESE